MQGKVKVGPQARSKRRERPRPVLPGWGGREARGRRERQRALARMQASPQLCRAVQRCGLQATTSSDYGNFLVTRTNRHSPDG